jgi:serine/threonine-protein kinase
VKVLHPSLARDQEALSRFRREAEITSALRHPHIVQLYDFNVTDRGIPYLVMELLEGQSLADRVATGKPFDPRAAATIVGQIAQALQVAHERGIVHRDLKPDNVILLSGGGVDDFVKLVDFGISQASWRPRLTGDAQVVGTPQYMSPEQALGRRDDIDPRCDQFSLAAIAYAMFTGREPFKGDDPVAVLYQVVHEDPVAASSLAPWLPPEIDAILARGLAKERDHRYTDILAFAGALRAAIDVAIGGAPIATPEVFPLGTAATAPMEPALEVPERPAGPVTLRLIRKVRRRIRSRPSGLAILAVLAVAAVFLWLSPSARANARVVWGQMATAARAGYASAWRILHAPRPTAPAQEPSRSGAVSMP